MTEAPKAPLVSVACHKGAHDECEGRCYCDCHLLNPSIPVASWLLLDWLDWAGSWSIFPHGHEPASPSIGLMQVVSPTWDEYRR